MGTGTLLNKYQYYIKKFECDAGISSQDQPPTKKRRVVKRYDLELDSPDHIQKAKFCNLKDYSFEERTAIWKGSVNARLSYMQDPNVKLVKIYETWPAYSLAIGHEFVCTIHIIHILKFILHSFVFSIFTSD